MSALAHDRAASPRIAIIAMAGRFPGAPDLDQFWANLRDGVESVRELTQDELSAAGVDASAFEHPDYIRSAGVLADVAGFDASFFNYNPREAELTDPQHRIFLEAAWQVLERAGAGHPRYRGSVGVFAGSHPSTYYRHNLSVHAALMESASFPISLGNNGDFLATRVAYKLNLSGMSVGVQSACSSSLLACALACDALVQRRCDLALAGGVTTWIPQGGYRYTAGGIASRDGHCRPFAADADGSVPGSGVGIVALKRLDEAVRDRDRIHAVLIGWGVNNDGADKVGFTAPSVGGQAQAIAMAHDMAGISADTISYVEAHGTGTRLGDPVEFAALERAFRRSAHRRQSCAIGSVKGNIGHLDAAAGVAGLIKTVLAIERHEIPPSLNCAVSNPAIPFDESPFFINRSRRPWTVSGHPRRAGISAFGLGGTNVHVVIEEAPVAATLPAPSPRPEVVLLSAKRAESLDRMAGELNDHVRRHSEQHLRDIAYTTQVGREHFAFRHAIVVDSREALAATLQGRDPARLLSAVYDDRISPSPVLMFGGFGEQHGAIGRELYERLPVFRDAFDRAANAAGPLLGRDLRTVLATCGNPSQGSVGRANVDLRSMFAEPLPATSELDDIRLAHPLLFSTSFALAHVWLDWGVEPAALVGYSLGEYVAACLAGTFTLEDALRVIVMRSELVSKLDEGAMLAVGISESELLPLLPADVTVAAINGPALVVVAGHARPVRELSRRLTQRGIAARLVPVNRAFHTPLMEPVIPELLATLKQIDLRPPQRPFVSNVTGTWIDSETATDPFYWCEQLVRPVRFADCLATLRRLPHPVLIESSAGNTLSSVASQSGDDDSVPVAIASLPGRYDEQSELTALQGAAARAWLAGLELRWDRTHEDPPARVELPTYPFEHRAYWINRGEVAAAAARSTSAIVVRKEPSIDDWFYIPSWHLTLDATSAQLGGVALPTLVFADQSALSSVVIERLRARGELAAVVVTGPAFARHAANLFTVRPDSRSDYEALLRALSSEGGLPRRLVHFWLASEAGEGHDAFDWSQQRGFSSVLACVQAAGRVRGDAALSIVVISAGMCGVTGRERRRPEGAAVLGLSTVLPQELGHVSCRVIDLDADDARAAQLSQFAAVLEDEIRAATADPLIAYRHGRRWVASYLRQPLPAATGDRVRLRSNGAYVITGGLGRVGLRVAQSFVTLGARQLVLIGRTGMPPRAEWDSPQDADTVRRIEAVRSLERSGAAVTVCAADVADEVAMQRAFARATSECGGVAGVVHAAGLTDASAWTSLQDLSAAACEPHFRAKARGLYVLERTLRNRAIDFCLIFSSTATVVGGLGFGAYGAANAFAETFTECHNASGESPWNAIAWDGWTSGRGAKQGLGSTIEQLLMTETEAEAALRRALGCPRVDRLIVSVGDLNQRRQQWVKPYRAQPGESAAAALEHTPTHPHPRPAIRSEFVSPRDDIEQAVCRIWSSILGVESVGVFDNFFELGGHSLLGMQVIGGIRRDLGLQLPIWDLFRTPTVAALAAKLVVIMAEEVDVELSTDGANARS